MTFRGAKNKLKKMAKGEYHTIGFQLTEHTNGELETKVSLYINGKGEWFTGSTFAEVFLKLEKKIEEIPDIDDGAKEAKIEEKQD